MAYEPYSVLMTVYCKDNPEEFRMSLSSMLTQTVMPDEVVLVTDGPIGENLQFVVDALDALYPGIIREICLEQNVGLGKALQIGVPECRHELIARMDADDISLPERCERQLKAFSEQPELDIVGCQIAEFDTTPEEIVGYRHVPESNDAIYHFAKLRDPFNHPTVMFRKSKVLESGNYGDYRKNQDSDLWIKMLSHHAVCRNLPDDVFRFRFDCRTYAKRKNWLNTKTLLEIRYQAWRNGYNTLPQFLIILFGQLARYLLPMPFQKILYAVLKGKQ